MRTTLLAIAPMLFLVAACEGEPPKTAAAAVLPPTAVEPGGNGNGAAANEEPAASAPAAPLAPCGCSCNCPGAVTASAADGGAPAADAGAAAAVTAAAPPAAQHADISGDITSTPKASAANAVVYLEGAPIEPNAKMNATVANRMMNFIPFVSVVPVGGKIYFRNDDPFPHNVFSPDAERFNMGMIPQNEVRSRTFKSPGSYSLLCNVHPGMLGYVVVVPSSYFAKTDAHGHFVIKNVPAGNYKITAWAPRVQPSSQEITVKDADVTAAFELHR